MKKIIFINFLVIFFLILFLEILANYFKLSGLMGIQNDLIYNKNNQMFLHSNKEGLVFNERIFTDKYGFRVPYKNYNYKKKNRTFILGDSVAFGNGIREEETFIGLLRQEITNREFINSSVPGYQLKDYINIIQRVEKFKNVTEVIYFFTLNDIYSVSNVLNIDKKIEGEQKTNEGSFILKNIKFINNINIYLRNKSYLYMLLKGLGTDPSKRWFLNLFQEYEKINSKDIEKNLNIINKFVKSKKLLFKVIILPYEYQTRYCSTDILLPQNQIVTILENLKIEYFDTTNTFCSKENPKNYYYKFDPMHLSKKGHKLMYEYLINEVNF